MSSIYFLDLEWIFDGKTQNGAEIRFAKVNVEEFFKQLSLMKVLASWLDYFDIEIYA